MIPDNADGTPGNGVLNVRPGLWSFESEKKVFQFHSFAIVRVCCISLWKFWSVGSHWWKGILILPEGPFQLVEYWPVFTKRTFKNLPWRRNTSSSGHYGCYVHVTWRVLCETGTMALNGRIDKRSVVSGQNDRFNRPVALGHDNDLAFPKSGWFLRGP